MLVFFSFSFCLPYCTWIWLRLKRTKNFASTFSSRCFGNVTLPGHSRPYYYSLFWLCWVGTCLQTFNFHPFGKNLNKESSYNLVLRSYFTIFFIIIPECTFSGTLLLLTSLSDIICLYLGILTTKCTRC